MRDNWKNTPLRELVKTIKAGGTPSSTNPDFYNGGIPFVSIEDITDSNKILKKTKKFLSKKGIDASAAWIVPKGYLVYSMYASVGKVRHLDIDAATSQAIIAINNDSSEIDKDYLYYFLLKLEREIYKYTSQTTQANLNAEKVKSFKILYPPLPQQNKIAKILSTVDTVIEQTETAIAKYQGIKQGLMHDLFTRGIDVNTGQLRPTPEDAPELYKESALGLIPKEWMVKKSIELMTFYNGRAYSITEWEDKGTPVIRLQNLTGSGKDFYYSNLKLPDNQYCHKGDLLYMWSATFGPHIWQGPKAIYHYHIWKVICNECLYNKDFAHIELSRFTEKVMQTSQGSTMAHITKGRMEDRLISLPQLKEQNIISESLNSLKNKIQTEQQVLAKYQQLKAGLMQDLLTGKVEVSVE